MRLVLFCVLTAISASLASAGQPPIASAKQILAATRVKGGLVVHLGCGDGKLTAALHANDSYLVHGLDRDAGNVRRARKDIDEWTHHLHDATNNAVAHDTVVGPAKHPDFDHLTQVKVETCDLGWRIRTPSGKVGLALQKLAKPLTQKATFKLRLLMIPNASNDPKKPPPGNAFLVLGDAADDEHSVKCGLRNAGQRCLIVEGLLMTGKTVSEAIKSETEKVIHCAVTVDLAAQKVTMQMLGKTTEKKLERRLERIAYIGYAVNSVASEFGQIGVTGR